MENKKFSLTLSASGDISEILSAMEIVKNHIHNSPRKVSRIDARYLRHNLRQAHIEQDDERIKDLCFDFEIVWDACPQCLERTPTIRTSKACKCAYCDTDRTQDITGAYKDARLNVTALITELPQ